MVTVLQQHYPSLRSLIALQCGIYNIKYIHIVTLSCQSYHISPATNLCWQLHQTFRTSNILWFIFDLPKQYYLNIYLRILVSSKQSTTIISLKGWQKSCFTFELLVLHRTVFEVLENGGQLGSATVSAQCCPRVTRTPRNSILVCRVFIFKCLSVAVPRSGSSSDPHLQLLPASR